MHGAMHTAVPTSEVGDRPGLDAVYTVQAGDGAWVRAVTHAARCPVIHWDAAAPQAMSERAVPASLPARRNAVNSTQSVEFPVRVCEARWPAHARTARVQGMAVPAPARSVQRMVVIADTGCRMKGTEGAFQSCNDPEQWTFARIAAIAATTQPDLVVHLGDLHYRESPCPDANEGCRGSPWGYGYDAWKADFFAPAQPLLKAAPWVLVRGNHESCARAGQGWMRFFDTEPWSAQRACNDPVHDGEADFSRPYAVKLADQAQLLVFDSSRALGKPYKSGDPALGTYLAQLDEVSRLASQTQSSFFLSHHPVLAFEPSANGAVVRPGNAALQSVMAVRYPQRLFAPGVDVAMHGHFHLFESLSFTTDHPATLVLGNTATASEGAMPSVLSVGGQPFEGAVVEDFWSTAEHGFATLDRADLQDPSAWTLTEYNVDGVPTLRCDLARGKSRCTPLRDQPQTH